VKASEAKITISFGNKLSHFLGYNHRFKRRVNKIHPNVSLFIDSIRREVNTIHNLILGINSGMRPREKRPLSKTVEETIQELYDRFDKNNIAERELLRELSFLLRVKNKL
jgi:hypothetical protein